MARLKSIVKSVSSLFQALKHGAGNRDGGVSSDPKDSKAKSHPNNISKTHQSLHKRLSASDGYINARTEVTAPHQREFQNSNLSLNSQSVSDVPKLVAHFIEEAASPSASPYRQPIRVINGFNPSLQSQVLLNTKTSQPFEDLVKDLAMSVRTSKYPIGNLLQTLAGRQIRSYSQLRSELLAGQRTFYVSYEHSKASVIEGSPNPFEKPNEISRNQRTEKLVLTKLDSNSSSEFSVMPENHKRRKPRRTQAENKISHHTRG